VALVTGAAQGIGQAIAVALAERGAQVIATDLAPPHETVEKIGPTAHAFQLDVTQAEPALRALLLGSCGSDFNCSPNYLWCICTADIVPTPSRSLQWECPRVTER
jgi:saccharopine dehydrogenase-like NADP-dependent oxidoreductase